VRLSAPPPIAYEPTPATALARLEAIVAAGGRHRQRQAVSLDRIDRTPVECREPQPALDGIDAVDEPPRPAAPPAHWQSALRIPDTAQVAGRKV